MTEIEKILPHIVTVHDLDKSITTSSVGGAPVNMLLSEWTVRMATRCIAIDFKTKRIALQQLDSENVIKLPGGGLQYTGHGSNGEDFQDGITRELAEEVGVDAHHMTLESLGVVIEYRTEWKLIQISYCYVGTIAEGAEFITPLEEGSHLIWANTPAHAIALINEDDQETYDKRFIRTRDTAVLEFYQSTITL